LLASFSIKHDLNQEQALTYLPVSQKVATSKIEAANYIVENVGCNYQRLGYLNQADNAA